MTNEAPISKESIQGFNSYATELRSRVEILIKQLMIVSGGILSITMGAYLNGKTVLLPESALKNLETSWVCFAACIIFSLFVMLIQTISMVHVVYKRKDKIENKREGIQVFNTFMLVRILVWLVGLSAFFACIAGLVFIAIVASSLVTVVV